MRLSLAILGVVLSVGTATAQTAPVLPDLTVLGSGLGDIGGTATSVLHPASLPLLVPVACMGNCAATVATICQGMGYPAASSSPIGSPGLLASGVCLSTPRQ